MSGGAYNYISERDLDFEISRNEIDEISAMVSALREYGADDVADETERFLDLAGRVSGEINAKLERLQKVWKAVEWYESGDWGEDDIHQAVTEYRNWQNSAG